MLPLVHTTLLINHRLNNFSQTLGQINIFIENRAVTFYDLGLQIADDSDLHIPVGFLIPHMT